MRLHCAAVSTTISMFWASTGVTSPGGLISGVIFSATCVTLALLSGIVIVRYCVGSMSSRSPSNTGPGLRAASSIVRRYRKLSSRTTSRPCIARFRFRISSASVSV